MTYAEFLQSQGATPEEIAILNTPVAQKAFLAMETQREEAVAAYKDKADKWYNETILPTYTKAQADATKAAAEAARLRALVASSQDEGLKAVAKEMGYNLDGTTIPPKKDDQPPPIDTSKFVTQDTLASLGDRVGDGLAAMQDMVIEHSQLFPTQRLDVRKLRAEAVAAKKSVYEYWEQKFNVSAAREAADKTARAAAEAQIRKDERDKVIAEMANSTAPGAAPGQPSSNIFVPRPTAGREKQPWEVGLDAQNGSNDRTARATKLFVEKQGAGRAN